MADDDIKNCNPAMNIKGIQKNSKVIENIMKIPIWDTNRFIL